MTDEHLHPDSGDTLSVDEALEHVLSLTRPLSVEKVPLTDALGAVLAQDVVAGFDIPPFANSGMDGYAILAADVVNASPSAPVTLTVAGEISAGDVPQGPIQATTAVRIMTGAPVPENAEAVVPFEDTDESERKAAGLGLHEIRVLKAPSPGANIRSAGEDIANGDLVMRKGQQVRPADVGVAASMGLTRIEVIRRPAVAIISTGDEIVEPGNPLPPGSIYNSNSHTIGALVRWYGGIPDVLGTALDSEDSLNALLDRAQKADLVLTSAGVSKGEYDVVKSVLATRGQIVNRSVRMKPARPLAFGTLDGAEGRSIPHLGLPGNPVAVVVAFETFARPAILAMRGIEDHARRRVEATLDVGISNRDRRRVFARVIVYRAEDGSGLRARPSGAQGSGVLTAVAAANGFAICPEESEGLQPGDRAMVEMLDWSADMVHAEDEI